MWWEIVLMSFESLLAKKTRSFLSMLGVIIGVSTVIAVFAIGEGAKKAVDDQFQNLSANSIMITEQRGFGATGSSKLDDDDALVLLEEAETLSTVSVVKRGNATVAVGAVSESLTVMGTDERAFAALNLKLAQGILFSAEQVESKEMVAVIGAGAATTLFNDAAPLEQTIVINNKRLTVIGVLAETGASGMMSYDDAVFLPYSVAEKNILGDRAMVMIYALARDVNQVEAATAEIETLLRTEHRLKTTQENDFQIRDAGSMVSTAQDTANMMALLLTSIAAITLLVSGIGIMNVMFVTVAERTKEIGIAKAIGGKQSDILGQFLMESIVLSVVGGVIGIGFGQLAIGLLAHFNTIEIVTLAGTIKGPAIGFAFSVVVGVFFGLYPAVKASRLDPVDALRSE